ncbi:MAG TPA: hypothetical protein DCP69_05415 [Candidatus Omnitrophica bacterium]|nr:hypothetical protein [Candidatus Omnitrophota bacterium]
MSDSWHSYPSIFALGHRALAELFLDPVVVQEKIDGSQFSMGRFGGELRCRSKGAQLVVDAPEKMFQRAVEVAASLDLHDGWTYRTEYLRVSKHNALAYDRVPEKHLILFDANPGHEEYLAPVALAEEGARLRLEVVPLLHWGSVGSMEEITRFLETTSILGGQKIEGIVVKNYARFGLDKKALMGKYVSEKFKEVHALEWKLGNPKAGDIIAQMIDRYRTPARWQKALQHLAERGGVEGSPRDIGPLIREVPEDVERECADEIREALWTWAWPKIRRGLNAGLPEWYKSSLAEQAFPAAVRADNEEEDAPS